MEEAENVAAIEATFRKAGIGNNSERRLGTGLVRTIGNSLRAREVGRFTVDLRLPEQRVGLLVGDSMHGAAMVPTLLSGTLYEKFIADSAVMSAGPTIMRTDHGDPINLPRLSDLGALAITHRLSTDHPATGGAHPNLDGHREPVLPRWPHPALGPTP